MNLRTILLSSTLTFGLGGCSDKSAVEEVMTLVERCWKYVDTGDFPSRGLLWVRGTTPLHTYDDRGANLRVQYAGKSLDDLFCAVSNHRVAWSQTERDAVFDTIDKAASEWVALRNGMSVEDIRRSNVTNRDYKRHLVFRPNTDDKAFLAIREDANTGIVTVLAGRGAIL